MADKYVGVNEIHELLNRGRFFDINYVITFLFYINFVFIEGINMLWAVLFV